MNKKLELILHEVERQFRSERAFYHKSLGVTQRAWEKYKSGETDFNNIKLSTYARMKAILFTHYETMLIDKAVEETNYNWHDNVVTAFLSLRMKHAEYMLANGADIELYGAISETGQPTRKSLSKLKVVDKLGNSVSFVYPAESRPPSGKRNRREWWEMNKELFS